MPVAEEKQWGMGEDAERFEDVKIMSEGEQCGSKMARVICVFFATLIACIPLVWPWCIVIVREYQRAVHFRLGKITGGAKGPGIFFFLPFVDSFHIVDLRMQTLDVPSQDMITKDSVTVSVNAVIFLRVVDPNRVVVRVNDYSRATSLLAQTILRSVVGESELDDLLGKREHISTKLRTVVDKRTDPWGVKVVHTEIKDVILPPNMTRAMASQAEAERLRRAKVISAEGEMQASITLRKAAETLRGEPISFQLRFLQTLAQVSTEKNSTIVFPMPIDILPLLKKIRE